MSSNNPGAGHTYDPVPVAWMKRDLLLFANSIGATADELHFLYELHPRFQAFPTYPVILTFKHADQEVIDFYARSAAAPIPGVPQFDSRRVVDGERKMVFHKPIPVTSEGRRFETRTKVLGVFDKGKPGTVVETETVLVDADSGDKYTTLLTSSFYVGQGGWGGPKGPKNPSFTPPKDKSPDVTFSLQLTPTSALLYRLNGDYNPLHATPEPGKAMGFGGAIMHGLFSWNSTAHGILQELGGSNPANLKEFQARFAAPVLPGDKLVVQAWRLPETRDKDGFEEVRFVTSVEGKSMVLSNGRAVVKVVGKTKTVDSSKL